MTGAPPATAAVTSVSTHVFCVTAPRLSTFGSQVVGRLLHVTPVSVHVVLSRRATLPPAGLPPLLMFSTCRRSFAVCTAPVTPVRSKRRYSSRMGEASTSISGDVP